MAQIEDALPVEATRIRAFARFFKNYMSVSSVVVAALPIPLTGLGALPTFADHKTILATYTSLFCFLTLGFIFYLRHSLARWMFPQPVSGPSDDFASVIVQEMKVQRSRAVRAFVINALPFLLIVGTMVCMFFYQRHLDFSIVETAISISPAKISQRQEILAGTYLLIPGGISLIILYIGIFVCAEAAFYKGICARPVKAF
jgi:hypothetical protein